MGEETALILYGTSALLGTLVYGFLALLTLRDLIDTHRYPIEFPDRQRRLAIASWRNFLFAVVLGCMFFAYDAVVLIQVLLPEGSETRVVYARLVLVIANFIEMFGGVLLLVGRRMLNEQKEQEREDGERELVNGASGELEELEGGGNG